MDHLNEDALAITVVSELAQSDVDTQVECAEMQARVIDPSGFTTQEASCFVERLAHNTLVHAPLLLRSAPYGSSPMAASASVMVLLGTMSTASPRSCSSRGILRQHAI